MTTVYFVRHAQSDFAWSDERTRPLSEEGIRDRLLLLDVLGAVDIDAVYSSPFRRAVDTVGPLADQRGLPVFVDERLAERTVGPGGRDAGWLRRRWLDWEAAEEGGECLASVQKRNVQALEDLAARHPDQTLVIGTHGTALSTILNHLDPSFGLEGFLNLLDLMPHVVRFECQGRTWGPSVVVWSLEKPYRGENNLKEALNTEPRVEPAPPGIEDQLADLRARAMRPSLEAVGRFDPVRVRQRLLADYDQSQTWVVRSASEELLGFFCFRPLEGGLFLKHLYIDVAHQGRGLGSFVLGWIEDTFRPGRIGLNALKGSPSNRFYQSHGFTLVGVEGFDNVYEKRRSPPS